MGTAKPETLGHIDCPTCNMQNSMAIKLDKNGQAFGFCEDCAQQLFTRNDFKSKKLLARMRPVAAPAAPEPQPAPPPAAPEGAGAAKPAAPAPIPTKPEKTAPAPVPAAPEAQRPAPAPWFAPIIGRSARKAA